MLKKICICHISLVGEGGLSWDIKKINRTRFFKLILSCAFWNDMLISLLLHLLAEYCQFLQKMAKMAKDNKNFRSREPLVVRTLFITHFNENMHFPISGSHICVNPTEMAKMGSFATNR